MNAYQCKISVKNSRPPVWWRVLIPAGISFSSLSLLLDELCEASGNGFCFEIFRCARAWEPGENSPLKADYYYDAYSAAHTPIDRLFRLGRPIYCTGAGQALKIEVEREAEDYPFSYPLLVKCRTETDGQALYERLKRRFVFSGEPAGPLSRQELLAGKKDGKLSIGKLTAEPIRDETYLPSTETLLTVLGSNLRKALAGRESSLFSMRALLGTYPKKDLEGLGKEYKLRNVKSKSAEALADELAGLLLETDMVRRSLSLLADDEIEAFEAALSAGLEYEIPEEQEGSFDTLSHLGYAFVNPEEGFVSIPAELDELYRELDTEAERLCVKLTIELDELYRELDTEAFRLERRKLNWVIQCLNRIVPPYYGILPMRQFCRLCRRTEDPKITAEEVPALLAQIPEGFTNCVVKGDEVCAQNLAKSRKEYAYVVSVQEDKPWYIMREKEIAELLRYGYPPHETSYRKFREYLCSTLRTKATEIEAITAELHLLMALDYDMGRWYKVFEEHSIRPTRRQLEELLKLLQDMCNNTPTFYNRGYTPSRMAEIAGRDRGNKEWPFA